MERRNSLSQFVGICHRYNSDENLERGNWARKLDFLLSLIGYAVGLGNIWRFPYKLYDNGASMLIPYAIVMILAGIPMFLLEMCLGQFSSNGPISLWRVVPLCKGLGWAMVIMSFSVCIYYNMVIAYTIFYIFASLNKKLPWADCQEEWLRYGCTLKNANDTTRNLTVTRCETVRANESSFNQQHEPELCSSKSPSEIYWEYVVLQRSSSISEGSSVIHWHLVLCLLATWIITFSALCRGIRSSIKVVYITATFPFIVMVILLLRNTQLPGSLDGIKFYFVPKFENLKEMEVWYNAAFQVFYSLGISFGGLQTMASYNRFHNNVYGDSLLVPIVNVVASITAGLVISTVMGFIAHETGLDISTAVETGPGLAFIAYPTGLAMMPGAPFWSVCFFALLCTLAIDSQLGMMETIISAVSDEFNWGMQTKKRVIFTFCLCFSMFLLGLPQCAKNGVFVMNLLDWYSASYSIFLVALLEIIAIQWIYGWQSLCLDIKMMTESYPNIYWRCCWIVFSPMLILFILVCSVVQYRHVSYDEYIYEIEMNYVGIAIACSALLPVLICAGIAVKKHYTGGVGLSQAIRLAARPAVEWGPRLDKHREGERYSPLRQSSPSNVTGCHCPCHSEIIVRTTVFVTNRSGAINTNTTSVTTENQVNISHL